jgi:hypothetical protein
MDQSPFNDQTINLINEALDLALDTVAQEDDLFPFVLTMNGEDIKEHDIECEDPDEAVEHGRSLIRSLTQPFESYALAYVGEVDLEDGSRDAIIVEVGEKSKEMAYVVLQPYEILETDKEDEIDLNLIGECFIADEIENLTRLS